MILSKPAILEAHDSGDIVYLSDKYRIEDHVQSESVDLHLGRYVWVTIPKYNWGDVPEDAVTDIRNGIMYRLYDLRDRPDGLWVFDREWILGHTEESIGTRAGSSLHPQLHLRSTAARCGIDHALAWYGDEGYSAQWAVELTFHVWRTINEGMRLFQMSFSRTTGGGNYVKYGNYQSNDAKTERAEFAPEKLLPKEGGLYDPK